MATPTPTVSGLSSSFENRLLDLAQQALVEQQARQVGGQAMWFAPTGWNGDVFDWDGLGIPFDRQEANQAYVNAVKDANRPGVSTDIVATTTQIDYVACMERSFRVRHTLRRPRATAQLLGRKKGHGSPSGPLLQSGVEYLRSLLAQEAR